MVRLEALPHPYIDFFDGSPDIIMFGDLQIRGTIKAVGTAGYPFHIDNLSDFTLIGSVKVEFLDGGVDVYALGEFIMILRDLILLGDKETLMVIWYDRDSQD